VSAGHRRTPEQERFNDGIVTQGADARTAMANTCTRLWVTGSASEGDGRTLQLPEQRFEVCYVRKTPHRHRHAACNVGTGDTHPVRDARNQDAATAGRLDIQPLAGHTMLEHGCLRQDEHAKP
jgi:hypothetical protein